jgi:hypothetical protein
MASGGIHEPPGRAARGLLEWGTDLWHYVNGRALVNGLKLSGMEASDMLDVLHYFFEDDMNYSTGEQAEARDKTRSSIYRELYGGSYKYSTGANKDRIRASDSVDFTPEQDAAISPFESQKDSKPYVAPTPFDPSSAKPFGKVLDAPLG